MSERTNKSKGTGITRKQPSISKGTSSTKKVTEVGNVYRGRTKYIDKEPKAERNYVVVSDNGKRVSVAKLKSIKTFDKNNRNADKALVEINATRYGLKQRTGVDCQTYDRNLMSGAPLKTSDKKAFPEGKEKFKLGSHDLHNTLRHTKRIKSPTKTPNPPRPKPPKDRKKKKR